MQQLGTTIFSFLSSVKHPPDEASPPQFFVSNFNGLAHPAIEPLMPATPMPPAPAASAGAPPAVTGGGGSGFLYNLLTARDASAVQQRSAFHAGCGGASPAPTTSNAAAAAAAASAAPMNAAAADFPRRSNSMGNPTTRRGSAHLLPPPPPALQPRQHQPQGQQLAGGRPSSVPRGFNAAAAAAAATSAYSGLSPSTSSPSACGFTSSEEPLDLSSSMRAMAAQEHQLAMMGGDADSSMGSPPDQQPMLRTILSQAAHRYQTQLQPVQLAKKNVMVAQSHVSDWLRKGSELVHTNAALFGALDRPAQAALLCRAWPSIIQLYMLENSFHFAVTPCSHELAEEQLNQNSGGGRLPTKKFAEDLQRLISTASAIPFDNMTYNLLRLAAIFKPESAHEIHLHEVQEEIMKHVLRHLEMKGMARHTKDAVAMLQAVSATDKDMLENLFCRHLLSLSVDEFIKTKLGC
uniref:NR LBD domain-containing protein n=1 Tax=Macrostomum lignano TaxID=282301 RepID=A0A1I8J8M1_9PLAT